MQINTTFENEELFRMETEDDATITVRKQGKKAQLLSIQVPRFDREEGIGTELLEACEQSLLSMGTESMLAYYPNSVEGMTLFLEKAGYTVRSVASATSIDITNLLSSVSVKKLLAMNTERAVFVPLSELINSGGSGLLKTVSKYKISINNSDLSRFHKEVSGVVYDRERDSKAILLCSRERESLVVELFAGIGEEDPVFFTSAIQGMLRGIIEEGGSETYNYLSLIIASPKVEAFMDRYLRKDMTQKTLTDIMLAQKTLTYAELPDTLLGEDIDEDKEEIWEREIRKIPLMSNTVFKMRWINSGDGSEGLREYLKNVLEEFYDEALFSRKTVKIREFGNLPFINAKPSDRVVPLMSLKRDRFEDGQARCRLPWAQERMKHILRQGGKGLEGRVSCCYVSDDVVTGMLLAGMRDTGELALDLIFADGGDEKTAVIEMLRFFVRAVMVRYGKDQDVIPADDPDA